jgi:replicative DNA helicase
MRKMREEFKHAYNSEVQRLLLGCLISDPDAYARCRAILRDEYFDDQLSPIARFILNHYDDFGKLPDVQLIQAKTGHHLSVLAPEAMAEQRDWFLKEIESFCRYRCLENAILDGIDLLRNGEAGEVERRVREATTISLISDLGTTFFADPTTGLHRMYDKSTFVSTGWPSLDKKLYGGVYRGGLNIFCGQSGSGKSLFLQNLALNWSLSGFIVVYFSLELAEEFVLSRLCAMITGLSTQEVRRDIDGVGSRIKNIGQSGNVGEIYIKKMPEGSTTVNHLRAYLKEFETRIGRTPDVILVDYLDLMHASDRRIDPSDMFNKDKFVSEEIRALHHETETFGATASQLNRSSHEANNDFQHSHIAGGISKINTADNVIGISAARREHGEYELQFLKTRASSAGDQRIRLKYDADSMRITDPDCEDETRDTKEHVLRDIRDSRSNRRI